MATTTVKSSGAFLERANNVASNALVSGNWSVVFATKFSAAVTGFFVTAFSIQAFIGFGGTVDPSGDWTELFQADPPDGDDIEFYYLPINTIGNPPTAVSVGSNASLVGKWLHFCITHNGTTGATHWYILESGFNPASPSFLVTPSVGNVDHLASVGNTKLWNDNSGDLGIGVSVGHFIQCNVELTQAQAIASFQQRAPTSTVTASTYAYLACDGASPSTVGTDAGNVGVNFTSDTTSGTFSQDTTQPSEWNVPVNGLFFGSGTTS